jgi:hypothetical protein
MVYVSQRKKTRIRIHKKIDRNELQLRIHTSSQEGSRVSVVGIVTGYGQDDRGVGV